jgi:Pectate lyase superfamily protein
MSSAERHLRPGRPAATRRSVLAGVAVGIGAAMARAPDARASVRPTAAAPASGGTPDWFNVVSRQGEGSASMTMPTPDWVNVKSNGAVGDGVTDDTAAIQAVLTGLEPTGGCVYLPTSVYLVSALVYNSEKPLYIKGDGCDLVHNTGGSVLLGSTAAAGTHILEIDKASVILEDFAILGKEAASGPDVDYAAILLNDTYIAQLNRMFVADDPATGANVNTAVKTTGGVKNFLADACTLYAATQGYWMNGGIQSKLSGCNCGTVRGTGGAGVQMDGGAGTLRLTNVQTDQGNYGFLMSNANGGGTPAFVFMNDVEFNNYATAGASFNEGHEVWMNQVWASAAGSPEGSDTYGMAFGTSFTGVVRAEQCVFQDNTNHSCLVEAGSGYDFDGCIFGSSGKLSANNYDELHIGGAAEFITVRGCHFNTDPFYGMGSPAPRSAIWTGTGAGNIGASDNICAGSGYGGGAGHGGVTSIGVWTGNLGGW